jgi:hypothetical protein
MRLDQQRHPVCREAGLGILDRRVIGIDVHGTRDQAMSNSPS